ncbi:MAG: PhoD-like phosphatase, partial [Cyanobacteria bacterium RM1_2_2]|nr:PhoD-like phosphatase [Cyanobacteria bacterium RM1_2_2]
KLVHGSCRKPHGGGVDAAAIIDDLLANSASQPQTRPHQLFLTGDQIYGDDVADPWLFALTDAGDTLLGWEEELPIERNPSDAIPPLKAKHLAPGQRSNVAENLAGFTAGLSHKADHTSSHLFSFGEYCSAYLFIWSPTLWTDRFPAGKDLYRDAKQIRVWDQAVRDLRYFFHSLWKVRRALANISTYMIFDDHDVSDDWYLNQAWCVRVLGKPLGRRVVQNALLAYALFQAWGNVPEQFEAHKTGKRLLQIAQTWSGTGGQDQVAERLIARWVGLPDSDPETGLPKFRQDQNTWVLDRHPDAMQWHYTIQSSCHEVVVLDTRTWRGYPIDEQHIAPPMLLSPTAFDRQIREPLQRTTAQALQTLVIAPTNLIHLRLIDWAQEWSLKRGKVFDHDVGDAWNLNKEALAELLAALFENRDRVVVLSGDIHYGFAARLNYWKLNHWKQSQIRSATAQESQAAEETKRQAQVLVQLTSSAFKNAELKTRIVQTKLKSLLPEPPQEWVGWNQTPELWKMQALLGSVRWRKLPPPPPLIRQMKPTPGNRSLTWTVGVREPQFLPDWQYRIEWVKRQPAQTPVWGKKLAWLQVDNPQRQGWQQLLYFLSWLWRNRWLQEGPEVVGYSNLGMVQFRGCNLAEPSGSINPPTVFQDLYWCPPWQPTSIVTSRFDGQLQPAEAATPFPLLTQFSEVKRPHRS